VTSIELVGAGVGDSRVAAINGLLARNKRVRALFVFEARQMLLSVLCADECGVVWPYFLSSGDTDGLEEPDDIEGIRADLAVVVEERRRRLICEQCNATTVQNMMRCSRCKTTRYCSRTCQLAHWSIHEPVCKTAVENAKAANASANHMSMASLDGMVNEILIGWQRL
jgi:hypothetical protein